MEQEEAKKTCCYTRINMISDMDTVGFLFERVKDRYCKKIDIEWFVEYYMSSLLRYNQEEGQIKLNNIGSQEVYELLMEKEPIKVKTGGIKLSRLRHYELMWIGNAYAYLHYHGDIRSRDLVKLMPFRFMRNAYITGHQLSFAGFFERCAWMITSYKELNKIDYTKETYEDCKERVIPEKIADILKEYEWEGDYELRQRRF